MNDDDDSRLNYNRLSDDDDGARGAGFRSRLVRFTTGGRVAEDAPAYEVRDGEDFRRALDDARREFGGALDRFGCEVSLIGGEERADRDWVEIEDVEVTAGLTPGAARAIWKRVANKSAAEQRTKLRVVK